MVKRPQRNQAVECNKRCYYFERIQEGSNQSQRQNRTGQDKTGQGQGRIGHGRGNARTDHEDVIREPKRHVSPAHEHQVRQYRESLYKPRPEENRAEVGALVPTPCSTQTHTCVCT